jgi:hypothetical protein
MVPLRSGHASAEFRSKPVTGLLLLIALASGGCSTAQHTRQHAAITANEPQRVAVETMRKPDLEDDGMEAQVPPPPSIRLAPDDPSEPFSPNYGQPATSPAAAPAKPATEPRPGPSRPGRSRFASAEAD